MTTLTKLTKVVEVVATEPCEAVQHGQEPCPLQYDDREEWCLSCLARDAMAEYLNQ
jgi:hypothetical protein